VHPAQPSAVIVIVLVMFVLPLDALLSANWFYMRFCAYIHHHQYRSVLGFLIGAIIILEVLRSAITIRLSQSTPLQFFAYIEI
jgi:hypothetical protein